MMSLIPPTSSSRKVVLAYKPDNVPSRDRQRPPGSQPGRYTRFDKSIPHDAELVLVPNQLDVVFGRGKGNHNHPGNLRMREIV
jgi:hypothetical protein